MDIMDFIFEMSPEEISASTMMHSHMNFIRTIAEDAEFEEILDENKKDKETMSDTIHQPN